jgi:hypothetical protein
VHVAPAMTVLADPALADVTTKYGPTPQGLVVHVMLSKHAAPFKHGLELHSSTSVAQFVPLNPAEHAHA